MATFFIVVVVFFALDAFVAAFEVVVLVVEAFGCEVVADRVVVVNLLGLVVDLVVSSELRVVGNEDEVKDNVDEAGTTEDITPSMQTPPRGLQPLPQWLTEDPHHPYCEQHCPNLLPLHVAPFKHLPSVLGGCESPVAVGAALFVEEILLVDDFVVETLLVVFVFELVVAVFEVETLVDVFDVEVPLAVCVLEPGEDFGTLPDPARYQFSTGSFKHSPTVTDLKPFLYIDSRM